MNAAMTMATPRAEIRRWFDRHPPLTTNGGVMLGISLIDAGERAEGVAVLNPVATSWWLLLWPVAFLAATLFALNFLGDGLRDALRFPPPDLPGKR